MTFVENTVSSLPKVTRAKFLGSDSLFCFISISKLGNLKNPFAAITSLSEFHLTCRRFVLLVQGREVTSMSYGSNKLLITTEMNEALPSIYDEGYILQF